MKYLMALTGAAALLLSLPSLAGTEWSVAGEISSEGRPGSQYSSTYCSVEDDDLWIPSQHGGDGGLACRVQSSSEVEQGKHVVEVECSGVGGQLMEGGGVIESLEDGTVKGRVELQGLSLLPGDPPDLGSRTDGPSLLHEWTARRTGNCD